MAFVGVSRDPYHAVTVYISKSTFKKRMKEVNWEFSLTLKRTGFLGGPIWNGLGFWGVQKCPLYFSPKIINTVTFKLSTKVAHLKYFKKMWWKYWGSRDIFVDIITFSRILRPLDAKVGTFQNVIAPKQKKYFLVLFAPVCHRTVAI